jgi:plastocyanin
MKRLVALVLVAAIAAVAGVVAVPAFAKTRTVSVRDNYFVKRSGTPTVTVKRRDTVRWVWRRTRAPHNVVVTRGPVKFRSPLKRSGSYRKRVTRRGTYRIVCTVHTRMKMTLRVR